MPNTEQRTAVSETHAGGTSSDDLLTQAIAEGTAIRQTFLEALRATPVADLHFANAADAYKFVSALITPRLLSQPIWIASESGGCAGQANFSSIEVKKLDASTLKDGPPLITLVMTGPPPAFSGQISIYLLPTDVSAFRSAGERIPEGPALKELHTVLAALSEHGVAFATEAAFWGK